MRRFFASTFVFLFVTLLVAGVSAQGAKKGAVRPKAAISIGPKVTQIDLEGLRGLLKPKGKPLVINFWATWCDPCREEFPQLVKLDAAYKGKIDFATVSFDDLVDIRTTVPKFLRQMKAQMPAYLLITPDENAAIELISKDWEGNLPLTMIFNADGSVAYMHKGAIAYSAVTAEVDKLLAQPSAGK
ncbi:MAG: TlpA family protein disulfide reductase [Acidobacteria bacterium]|nr:TlpA family protein disulfide reductase [Acidobacteriota bacterium]